MRGISYLLTPAAVVRLSSAVASTKRLLASSMALGVIWIFCPRPVSNPVDVRRLLDSDSSSLEVLDSGMEVLDDDLEVLDSGKEVLDPSVSALQKNVCWKYLNIA